MMPFYSSFSACMILGSLFIGPVAQAQEFAAESAVGKVAPEITVGKVWNTTGIPTNADLRGKAVVLEFYDTR
ncbi:MAG: hypothetical protein QF437_30895 [Planctomycetota bacterium]|jgi:hypothetical protein|nr:hypothetical protein [Planctomycetota bacterium]MDP7134945.1 hypothetical protein [Planctomycetota bacterium]MDP7249589.1 hypothetical protein [Planctomycetota bacterium]